MKIIGIVGIVDFRQLEDALWRHFRLAFKEQFPDYEFVVEHSFFLPWQSKRMVAFADSIVAKHDTGEDIMFLGYSLGGVIACAIAPRFKKSRVSAIVTVDAPHKMKVFFRFFGVVPHPLPFPVITFSGVFDIIVPWFLTRYPNSLHTYLFSDHMWSLLLSQHPAEVIAKKTRELLTGSYR